MSIIVNEKTKVLVQGITGRQGRIQTKKMLKSGVNVVSGVTPGKMGENIFGIPVFDTVKQAQEYKKADVSLGLVPEKFAMNAAIESLQNKLPTIIITEGVPFHDTLKIYQFSKKQKTWFIGPNCPGVITPQKTNISILPDFIFKTGNVGVASRSGTLTYEVCKQLTKHGIGQSTVIGLGGDPITGLEFLDVMKFFNKDSQTKKIVLVGEIGGNKEEKVANYIKKNVQKPVIAYISGIHAPVGKRMGHAGALVEKGVGTANSKIRAFEKAGVKIVKFLDDLPNLI